MARSPKDLLDYEARTKPEIAGLLLKVHTLSEADIDALPVLKWLRQALKAERRERLHAQALSRTEAALAGQVTDGFSPDTAGLMVRYEGPDEYLRFGSGQVLVPQGRLLFLPDPGGVWYETVFSQSIDDRLHQMRSVGRTTKTGYTAAYKQALLARCEHLALPTLGAAAPGPDRTDTPMGRLLSLGVRFGG